jgi:hypothetical protein
MVPLVGMMVLVASWLRRYPFGDVRTSTFWLVLCSAVAAIGLADVVDRMSHRVLPSASIVLVALTAACWIGATNPYIRDHPIQNEDVRSQVDYLNRHLRPGDTVILSYKASFGFAYYDTRLTPTFERYRALENSFIPEFPTVPWLVQMKNRTPADVAASLSAAKRLADRPGGNGRIWIVRSHLFAAERTAWQTDLAGDEVQVIPVGSEPLLLYTSR